MIERIVQLLALLVSLVCGVVKLWQQLRRGAGQRRREKSDVRGHRKHDEYRRA